MFFWLCFAGLLWAQTPGAEGRGEPGYAAGYATGHVICGDTQRPARLAQVRFVPMATATGKAPRDAEAPTAKMSDVHTDELFGSEVTPVETDMEGAFTVRNLKPGTYVVRVDLSGYLTPLLGFSGSEFKAPDEAVRQRMSRELQIVDVRPHAETRVDVTLQRGATLTGTVRFDDGSPAIGIGTQLMERNGKGEWEDAKLSGVRFGNTDSEGRYAIEAVPPGTYAVRANLSLSEFSNAVLPMNGNQVHVQMSTTLFSLAVYSGSVLRKREAVPIKVESAAVYDGNDLVLPISKLHRVSGAVMAEGHAVNGGKVTLRDQDDGSEIADVEINREDRQFHFPYVPEGSYTLAVTDARDVTEVEVANPVGVVPKTHTEAKTLRSYGKAEQPLVVESDVEGVLVTVVKAAR